MTTQDNPLETVCAGERTISLREITDGDRKSLLDFANRVPAHDLLFLNRDIRNSKVVDAWVDQSLGNQIYSLVAEEGGQIVGCVALVGDELGWSAHVTNLRLLVAPESRGVGVGRAMTQRCLSHAREQGVLKVSARMSPDQGGALHLFEELGFRPEALLRNEVKDLDGNFHDIAVMALGLN
ncbi:GNAT family N-acetyltransferase [Erythrobacter sp. SCSIO 43205]|uniref:GNAT family N-acetyltransferase n=1 Tax=Erythrobacter sp. SCSIO 43205 TaxID=2779361 RepID=UPI001CA9E630|nr:GNAT family N-acetyltransferase [Erythrobacter sp. SCSIO 43205]UAB79340.1 GNAT family N-acetyltransferase [Erythrobacter sp. SCSIO 43205]